MAEETIVPRRNQNYNLFNGTPNIEGVALPRTGQLAGVGGVDMPSQVEWTPPARTNELLQVSDALADLNPQLRAFSTSFIRSQSMDQKLAEQLAQEDANVSALDKARSVGIADLKDLMASGDVKPEQLPQYYTSLQKFSGERVAKADFYNFLMSAKDESGQPKYSQRLLDGNSTEDVNDVLNEATEAWLQSNASKSAIFNNSAREAINKMNVGIAEKSVSGRWEDRQKKMTETLIVEGQNLLTENELNPEAWEQKTQDWLARTRYVPGAVTMWARDSLVPYVERMAQENPDGARALLAKYENLRTGTGAKLGGGANFESFQRAYTAIGRIEDGLGNKNEADRNKKLYAISDHISKVLTDAVERNNGDPSILLNSDIAKHFRSQVIGSDVVITTEDGVQFRLDENNSLVGKAREMFEKNRNDLLRGNERENKELIARFRMNLAQGNVEEADNMYSVITSLSGWSTTGTNSQASAFQDLNKAKSGAGLYNNTSVKEAVNTISAFVEGQITGGETENKNLAIQVMMETASKDLIGQQIVQELKAGYELAKKDNPELNEFQYIKENINGITLKVREKVTKDSLEKVKRLENNIEKTIANTELKAKDAELPSLNWFAQAGAKKVMYQGQIMPSPDVLEKRHLASLKLGLQLKNANWDENNPNLTALERRSIAEYKKYRADFVKNADKSLELLAKDIQTGGYYRTGAMSEGTSLGSFFSRYSKDELVQKGLDYWRIKNMRGYSPEEISSGRTREGLAIPFDSKLEDGTGVTGDAIRNLTLHFQSSAQLEQALKEPNQDTLKGIYKRFGITGDAEEDAYIRQQTYLLELMR